ncbi:MAG: hypothetical protein Tp172MES766071_25 [Prokaryotic dsDNA virus sp.]|nr:MAG: hypothetical protein Tp172MES766071_25 [Prokaryotic dsDNA virus sp.]|tara:strand:- start:18997 stop:19188 length:192 start_codon:yes stop_codon:yes gene_type:complete
MTQEQSIQIIVQVCEKANKNGLFTLSESSLVLQALEQFGVTPPSVEEVKQDEETKSETKEVKE